MDESTVEAIINETQNEITQIPEEFQAIADELREKYGSSPSIEVNIMQMLRLIDKQERRIDRAKERKKIWTLMLSMEIELAEARIKHAKDNLRGLLVSLGDNSWRSPEGTIKLVRQQPAWLWPDDENTLIEELRTSDNTEFIREIITYKADKQGIKKAGLALKCVPIDPRHERRVDVQTPYSLEKKNGK